MIIYSISSKSKASPSPRPTVSMPKKPGKRGKVACGVCQGPVVDGKDEALLCEGKCGYWLHRGCASISPNLYRDLSNSDDPFVCLTCTNIQLKEEIQSLRSELSSLSTVREQVGALLNEVKSLQQAVVSLPTTQSRQRPNNTGRTYSYAKAATAPAPTRPDIQAANSATTTATTGAYAAAPTIQQKQQQPSTRSRSDRPKVKVDGARRNWGTVPTCSTRASLSS